MTVRRRKKLAKPTHKTVKKPKAPKAPKLHRAPKLHDHHEKKIAKVHLHEAHAANTILRF